MSASVDKINWFKSTEPLEFTIHPPFWVRWWFIAILIFLATMAAYYMIRKRITSIRSQEAAKRQNEVQLITLNHDLAKSQLTALRAQMNPHFIFNTLNSVQRYILKGDVDQANKYLSKFSRLQREVLDNSSLDFIALEKEIDILELYLQMEQLRFDDNFEFQIVVHPAIDTSEIQIPPMIIQPFIENAIWHGLMPRSGHKRVEIEFTLNTEELLLCRIVDNGIGRLASARLKAHRGNTPQHAPKGLSLVLERLQILEHLYRHPYQVSVLDRSDSSGVVCGTEVVLSLYIGR